MEENKTTQYDINWLLTRIAAEEHHKYLFFWGHSAPAGEAVGKQCFSQWYPAPFTVEGINYPTAEHWMMARKAMLFNDVEIFERIVNCTKPGEAKQLGREIRGFSEDKWLANRRAIVKEGNAHKFGQHRDLREFLLSTNDRILVEASPVDPIWGIGMAADNPTINDASTWKGLNLLGFVLMEVRDEFQQK